MLQELSCLAAMMLLGAVCMGIGVGPAAASEQPAPTPATSDEANARQVTEEFLRRIPNRTWRA